MSQVEIGLTIDTDGQAYVALVVGPPPEVRTSVHLGDLPEADAIGALDSLVLDFDHYGRLVGIQVEGSVESVLSPSLIDAT